MAISEAYAGAQAALATGDTEWSLTGDDTSVDAITTDGVYQCFLDLSDMAAGDFITFRVYEKAQSSDTQRVVYSTGFSHAQAVPGWASPAFTLIHGWDMTLEVTAGGTTDVSWSIRSVT